MSRTFREASASLAAPSGSVPRLRSPASERVFLSSLVSACVILFSSSASFFSVALCVPLSVPSVLILSFFLFPSFFLFLSLSFSFFLSLFLSLPFFLFLSLSFSLSSFLSRLAPTTRNKILQSPPARSSAAPAPDSSNPAPHTSAPFRFSASAQTAAARPASSYPTPSAQSTAAQPLQATQAAFPCVSSAK